MQVSGEELPAEGAGCEGPVCSGSGEQVTVAEGRGAGGHRADPAGPVRLTAVCWLLV